MLFLSTNVPLNFVMPKYIKIFPLSLILRLDAIFTLARHVQLKIMPIPLFKTKCYQILVSKPLKWQEADREKKLKCSSFVNLTSIDIFLQKREKIPIYRMERTALTFSASLPLLKWNHRRKGLQIDVHVGKLRKKIKALFLQFSAVQWIHVISIFVVIERMKRVWQPRSKRSKHGC